jgi:uncharacterized membrane protein
MVGFIALIIPGFFTIRGVYLSQYFLIDRKIDPSTAIRESFKASRPVSGYIWGTIGVMILFNFLGSSVSFIPVLGAILSIAVPLMYLFGPALRYTESVKELEKAGHKIAAEVR